MCLFFKIATTSSDMWKPLLKEGALTVTLQHTGGPHQKNSTFTSNYSTLVAPTK